MVVAVIGILASIALPSYNEHVRKSRRAGGAACAAAMAQGMERHYTTALTYVGADAGTLDDRCDPDALRFYTMGLDNVGAKTYRVTAAPRGGTPQAGDSCGTLSIDQAGTKAPSTTGCW